MTFNKYPNWWWSKQVKQFLWKKYSPTNSNSDEVSKFRCPVKIPYVGKPSETLKKALIKLARDINNESISFCFYTSRLSNFTRIKDHDSNKLLQSSLVYRFMCPLEAGTNYIGETQRKLWRRVVEHSTDESSAICRHRCHCITCSGDIHEQFKVLYRAKTPLQLTIAEALYIKKHSPTLNVQQVSGKTILCAAIVLNSLLKTIFLISYSKY